jgi:hypothetical protein
MSIARSVADVLRDQVVLEYEAIDRMYLNVYVPHLQTVGAMVGYLRVHRGQRFASTTAVAPMTEAFVCNIEQFVAAEGVDLRQQTDRRGFCELNWSNDGGSMWRSRQSIDFEAIVRKHIDREFSLFACGEKPPSQADIAAFERDAGCVLPSDFRAFSHGPLGGLYVEVKEEVWPRAKPLEVGPFWSFLYGLAVYGFAHDIPEWMDMRRQAEAFRGAVGDTYVPFLKIMADPDHYCFGKDGRISQWSHETGEFRAVDKSFAELKTRKERKKAQRAAG